MGKQGPCTHCGISTTPLWRNGPPDKPVLCNACGSRWRTRGTLHNYMPLHAGGLGLGTSSGKGKPKIITTATGTKPPPRITPSGKSQHNSSRTKHPSTKLRHASGGGGAAHPSDLHQYGEEEEEEGEGYFGSFAGKSLPRGEYQRTLLEEWEASENDASEDELLGTADRRRVVGMNGQRGMGRSASTGKLPSVPSRKRTSSGRQRIAGAYQGGSTADWSFSASSFRPVISGSVLSNESGEHMEDEFDDDELGMPSTSPGLQLDGGMIGGYMPEERSFDRLDSFGSAERRQEGRTGVPPRPRLPSKRKTSGSFHRVPSVGSLRLGEKKGLLSDSMAILPNRASLESFPYSKRSVLDSSQSPMVFLDLKDVVNLRTFYGSLTSEERASLMPMLPAVDSAQGQNSLTEMFASAQFESALLHFQQLISEGMFDPSEVGEAAPGRSDAAVTGVTDLSGSVSKPATASSAATYSSSWAFPGAVGVAGPGVGSGSGQGSGPGLGMSSGGVAEHMGFASNAASTSAMGAVGFGSPLVPGLGVGARGVGEGEATVSPSWSVPVGGVFEPGTSRAIESAVAPIGAGGAGIGGLVDLVGGSGGIGGSGSAVRPFASPKSPLVFGAGTAITTPLVFAAGTATSATVSPLSGLATATATSEEGASGFATPGVDESGAQTGEGGGGGDLAGDTVAALFQDLRKAAYVDPTKAGWTRRWSALHHKEAQNSLQRRGSGGAAPGPAADSPKRQAARRGGSGPSRIRIVGPAGTAVPADLRRGGIARPVNDRPDGSRLASKQTKKPSVLFFATSSPDKDDMAGQDGATWQCRNTPDSYYGATAAAASGPAVSDTSTAEYSKDDSDGAMGGVDEGEVVFGARTSRGEAGGENPLFEKSEGLLSADELSVHGASGSGSGGIGGPDSGSLGSAGGAYGCVGGGGESVSDRECGGLLDPDMSHVEDTGGLFFDPMGGSSLAAWGGFQADNPHGLDPNYEAEMDGSDGLIVNSGLSLYQDPLWDNFIIDTTCGTPSTGAGHGYPVSSHGS
eukprot:TRINITY_DN581_c0_g1_i2.p1 TRINITY_DN581_c0_g1~~TRINITY_DN581_c0_g1_i2.p1  ORF type:complete len:1027 (-),score=136.96 TRINITY_DN581_c0_g1_i2:1988-5068(-)